MQNINKLDDRKYLETLDESRCYDSIVLLPDQCKAAWEDIKKYEFPSQYKKASAILFTGMGGSAYGARIIKSLYAEKLKVPVDIINGYNLPAFVNKSTLVIAASYSGGTEETLSCVDEALERDCMLMGITSGGLLYEKLTKAEKPVYKFNTDYNPSRQPRLGQGYMQMGQIAMLNSLGYLSVSDVEVDEALKKLKNKGRQLESDIPLESNTAKKFISVFEDKIVNIIGSEFLEGALHAIRNPFHETGKHFTNYFLVPELNHHLMEGLSFPETNKKNLHFLIINSNLFKGRIQERIKLTKEVITKNSVGITEIDLTLDTKMEQVFELIQLGSFISFYLAMIHGVNPAKIPWVDYFKTHLS